MELGLKQMKKATIKILSICSVSLMCLPLAGCDLYEEGIVSQQKIQVEEQSQSERVFAREVTNAYLEKLASEYTRFGGQSMDVTVTYDPLARLNTAMSASDKAAQISQVLRTKGVREIKSSILPVKDQGEASEVIISYAAYSAHAPADCVEMPGLQPHVNGIEYNPDYKLGCSLQGLIAKQVAHPQDLLGRENTDHLTDGRAAANVVDAYRLGAPNKALDGETASEE